MRSGGIEEMARRHFSKTLFAALAGVLLFSGSAHASAALIEQLAGQADQAVAKRDWSKARLLYKRSLREAVREERREAVLYLRKQILKLPVDPAIIHQELESERYDDAFKHLKAYLNLNAGDVWAMVMLGTVYEAIGQDGQAERLYKRALSLAPDYTGAHYYYGRYLLLKKKNFEEALTQLRQFRDGLKAPKDQESKRQAAALQKEKIQATRWIASILDTNLKESDEAFRELESLVRSGKPDPEILYDYGVMALRLGRKRTAFDAFQRVITLTPQTALSRQAEAAIEVLRNTDSGGNAYADPYS